MDLSSGRTRVLKLLDDEDGRFFNADGLFTDLDDALRTGQLEAWHHALASGSNVFNVEAPFTSSSAGVVDLTAVKPRRIVHVAQFTSGSRQNVLPMRFETAPRNYEAAETLRVVYVPQVTFPANGAAPFVWGHANIDTPILDKLMCVLAALDLKPREAESNRPLVEREAQLRAAVLETLSVPSWEVIPLDELAGAAGRNASFGYVVTAPHTLQLVQE